ncbi:MAG: hypothetical protein LBC46_01865 [Treponema sp.]|jgi:hypothetical protein|nr:hypothetical protein [Treponema sp.]
MLNFKPFTSFRVLETRYFEIIFPEASWQTAERVAGFADGVYERVSALLGISLKRKMPVAITPHTDQFNSYMRSAPYPHIMLFDTPTDPNDFAAFENTLESVFLHELTHSISLSSRSPPLQVMYDIFGGWYDLTQFTAPLFMVEGVAVAFESLDGFGRANDPLTRQALRQAIIDNTFLTPFQASGVYDYPPSGAWYEYGGLFSAWLIKQYGMEKYAELWQRMGGEYHFSFFFYNNGFFHSFTNVYGMAFLDAWQSFQDSLRLDGVADNSVGIVRGGEALISAIDTGGGKVFALDIIAGALVAFDPMTGRSRNSSIIDTSSYDLDVSTDGSLALVSSYRYTEDLAAAIVTEYNTRNGWGTGRSWSNLYQGHYFRDGVIGLSSTRHLNNLVFRSGNGDEEVLLMGNESLILASPRAVNDTWIAFVAARNGIRELCLYNYDTKTAYTLSSGTDDAERWRYMRFLQASEGRLLFGFNHDDRFYKLGAIDLRELGDEPVSGDFSVVFSACDFSGGVSLPVLLGNEVYYRAAFSTWDALARYPEAGDALSGVHAPLLFTRWETTPSPANIPAVYGTMTLPTTRYNPLAYMNPFQFWLPLPLISVNAKSALSFDGFGIMSLMMDPTDTNLVELEAYMNIRDLMGAFSIQWTTLGFGFPLTFEASDSINKTQVIPYRRTFAGIQAASSWGLRLGATVSLIANDPLNSSNVYTWGYEEPIYTFSAGLDLNALRRFRWQLFGNGVSLNTTVRYTLPQETIGVEERLSAAFELFRLKLSLYYAWSSAANLDLYGRSLNHENDYIGGSLFSDVASLEYSTEYIRWLSWLAGGEAELKLFSLDIQKNLGHLYYNRLYSTLAYRSVFYNADETAFPDSEVPPGISLTPPLLPAAGYRLAQSLVLRLGMTISSVIITATPLRFTPYLWGAWKISDPQEWSDNLVLGFGLSLTL